MKESPDPNAPWTVIVGFVGVILLFVTVVLIEAVFFNYQNGEFNRKVVSEVPEELTSVRTGQIEKLNTYRWIDKASGTVAIPIDHAIELVVHEAAMKKAPASPPVQPAHP
jgi:hypothetical protein